MKGKLLRCANEIAIHDDECHDLLHTCTENYKILTCLSPLTIQCPTTTMMFIRVVLAILAPAGVTAASAVSTCENDVYQQRLAGFTLHQGQHCEQMQA
ncbi:hypothetical protein BDR03DRAFT_940306 [Suillus americanus]|nr:hypothetical protein BDR03DRAFT_940306 [Suillus americanus]